MYPLIPFVIQSPEAPAPGTEVRAAK
jgi:hypothetical protein